jgi:hypothetical protein
MEQSSALPPFLLPLFQNPETTITKAINGLSKPTFNLHKPPLFPLSAYKTRSSRPIAPLLYASCSPPRPPSPCSTTWSLPVEAEVPVRAPWPCRFVDQNLLEPRRAELRPFGRFLSLLRHTWMSPPCVGPNCTSCRPRGRTFRHPTSQGRQSEKAGPFWRIPA